MTWRNRARVAKRFTQQHIPRMFIPTMFWGLMTMAQPDAGAIAQHYLTLLTTEKYADAAAMHDAAMSSALPEPALRNVMAQVGPLKDCKASPPQSAGAFQLVVTRCTAATTKLDVKISVDANGKVGGLFFTPVQAAQKSAASYVKPDTFSDEKVTVTTGRFELPGILSVPRGKGPFPAVVLVHGSGPHDLDETVGPNKPFKDLAEGLASKGVMVLRYEKRTHKYGAEMATSKEPYTVQDETIADAVSAVKLLRARKDVSRVVVLGHSLGGYLVPRIAQQAPDVAGLVVMSGNISPLERLVAKQIDHLLATTKPGDAERAQLEGLRKSVAAIPSVTTESGTIMGAPPSYWIDLRSYRPGAVAASTSQPMLLLSGDRDYQVPTSELMEWKVALKARALVTYKQYPSLNHLMMPGSGPSTPAEYAVESHVDGAVVDDVAAFVLGLH